MDDLLVFFQLHQNIIKHRLQNGDNDKRVDCQKTQKAHPHLLQKKREYCLFEWIRTY